MEEIQKQTDFLFYNDAKGKISVQVILGDETVWTSIRGMAEIFNIDRTGVVRHIQNIYETKELEEISTCAKIAQVQKEGNRDVNRVTEFYNLEIIIAVGYRVNSYEATKFRQWATRILKEYLVKGFALDDERLKQGNKLFGKDYFKELLDRIREIRASEKMFYEKITDLYATSVDYDKDNPNTHKFFAKVQNKLEFAIVGKTSAEIIKSRADSTMPNMNLKTWKNAAKDGKVQKPDVTIAKNYLNEDEIRKLNTLVNMYLDYAELQVERNRLMKMEDWSNRLDSFLKFNEYEVLDGAGKMRKDVADNYAENEYLKFRVVQDANYKSDFNKVILQIKESNTLPTENEIIEQKEIVNSFDKKLEGLLSVPPPNKDKKQN
jgi:hypothetical protein